MEYQIIRLQKQIQKLQLDLQVSERSREDLVNLLKKRQTTDFLFPERRQKEFEAEIGSARQELEKERQAHKITRQQAEEAVERGRQVQEKLEQTTQTVQKTVRALKDEKQKTEALEEQARSIGTELALSKKYLQEEKHVTQQLTELHVSLSVELDAERSRCKQLAESNASYEVRAKMFEEQNDRLRQLADEFKGQVATFQSSAEEFRREAEQTKQQLLKERSEFKERAASQAQEIARLRDENLTLNGQLAETAGEKELLKGEINGLRSSQQLAIAAAQQTCATKSGSAADLSTTDLSKVDFGDKSAQKQAEILTQNKTLELIERIRRHATTAEAQPQPQTADQKGMDFSLRPEVSLSLVQQSSVEAQVGMLANVLEKLRQQ